MAYRNETSAEKLKKMGSDELLQLLFMESSLEHFMTKDTSELLLPSFSEHITALSKNRKEAPERIP